LAFRVSHILLICATTHRTDLGLMENPVGGLSISWGRQ